MISDNGDGAEQSAPAVDFERARADVEAGRGPRSAQLPGLSHLLPEQIEQFRAAWDPLGQREKIALVDALHHQEAESLQLDFNAIYHLAMADDSPAVRRRALEATIEDDSAWLLERLLVLVVFDPEADVRAAAANALQPVAERAELGELDEQDAERVRAALLATIHRPGERLDVRAEALTALGFFSGEPTRREIEAGFSDEALRLHALRAMGHSADPAWLDTVLAQFDESDDVLREAAAEAAGEIGDEAAVPGLIELIDDPDLRVRLAALAALGEIGGDDAREALI